MADEPWMRMQRGMQLLGTRLSILTSILKLVLELGNNKLVITNNQDHLQELYLELLRMISSSLWG
jgi:hypothetical protein